MYFSLVSYSARKPCTSSQPSPCKERKPCTSSQPARCRDANRVLARLRFPNRLADVVVHRLRLRSPEPSRCTCRSSLPPLALACKQVTSRVRCSVLYSQLSTVRFSVVYSGTQIVFVIVPQSRRARCFTTAAATTRSSILHTHHHTNYIHYIHARNEPTRALRPWRPATQWLAPGTNSGESSTCPPKQQLEIKHCPPERAG